MITTEKSKKKMSLPLFAIDVELNFS
jgi:hypothetical protein